MTGLGGVGGKRYREVYACKCYNNTSNSAHMMEGLLFICPTMPLISVVFRPSVTYLKRCQCVTLRFLRFGSGDSRL